MADFTMPALGADMKTGKVVEWKVGSGDRIQPGDIVAVVETHKGAIEVECFLDGVITDLAPLGQDLPVGAVLARVTGMDTLPSPTPPAPPLVAPRHPATTDAPPAPIRPPKASANSRRTRVSPAARHRAQVLGIPPEALNGTGEEGAVTLADVEHAASTTPTAPAVSRQAIHHGFDPSQMRQAIAVAMGRSKREIPHYYLSTTVDFGAAQAWLSDWNSEREPADRLLAAVLLLKACAQALTAFPSFNGFYRDGVFQPAPSVHLGWAIALRGGGLVAPAIHNAQHQPLPALMIALRDLVQRARTGRLRGSELTDPTVTVTSLGDRGAENVLGVIYPPQVAIIGFGSVVERPWIVDGQIVRRPVVSVSLAADHRVSDGHLGGQLLAAIDSALQSPNTL